jgi:hypothetical protein
MSGKIMSTCLTRSFGPTAKLKIVESGMIGPDIVNSVSVTAVQIP